MSEDLIIKYAIGLGISLAFLIGGFAVKAWMNINHSILKKIIQKIIQTLLFSGFILTCRQYAIFAVVDFKLHKYFYHVIDVTTVALLVTLGILQVFLLIDTIEKYKIRHGSDLTKARMTSRLVKIVLVSAIVIIFGKSLGFSLTGLLAFGGMGGIIIGLASKDVLSNFLSGLMLFYNRQFDIGDWISSPDRNIEGTVTEIGWRITRIITFDKRPLYVPNSLFSSITVENPGRMTNRRIKTSIGLRYQDASKISAVVKDITSMLKNNTDIDQSKTVLVYFNEFADSSLNILVYCFTKTTVWAEWLAAQQNVYLQIIDIVHKNGADLAFSTTTLDLPENLTQPQSVVSQTTNT